MLNRVTEGNGTERDSMTKQAILRLTLDILEAELNVHDEWYPCGCQTKPWINDYYHLLKEYYIVSGRRHEIAFSRLADIPIDGCPTEHA
ncbi:hypothetical protein LCGC14_1522830 [marine sediment metagenome]|uniref:Uncharacterized protein n=1 Tax=marine sediment metagenome TaxID=412755 RepID=A0A0F9IYD1_9ZZZZ